MAYSSLIKSQRDVYEGTTFPFTATITDHRGDAAPLADISNLTLKLYVNGGPEHATIVNGRDDQNILNSNDVSVHATSGLLEWTIQDEDVATLDDDLADEAIEVHRALIRWELNNGHKGIHILDLRCHKVEGVSGDIGD